MIPFLLTGFACAIALVVFAAALSCAVAIVRVLIVAWVLCREWRDKPRAQARDRWSSALKGRW